MSKISPCLWFDGKAEEAANFYASLLPDSRVDKVHRAATETPSGPVGSVLFVEFTLAGQSFQGLNGGPGYPFTQAVSFSIACEDQAEIDRLWDALTADGGSPVQCGWLRDRYGLSWQIVPKAMGRLMLGDDPAGAKRAMEAMMKMVKLDIAELERAYRGV
ncbi:MAG TPA: VOC family protein [Allosphingosinicella sp.]|nr:VOC family protein [Allosphingosinicella sp.]